MTSTSAAGTGAKTVGAILCETRESRGVQLDDAANVTRIGKNYLLALEADQYDKLPSPAYVKGFLRLYAEYLGLSGDDIVARYEETAPRAAIAPGDTPAKPLRELKLSPDRLNRLIVPAILLILVLATTFFSGEREQTPAPPVTPGAQVRPAALPVTPQQNYSSATSAKNALKPSNSAEQAESAATANEKSGQSPKGIFLKLKVLQDCQLGITIDGDLSQQYDLKTGDVIEWKGERIFALDLDNAAGVEGEFNGKALAPLGEAGRPVHIDLKAEEPD